MRIVVVSDSHGNMGNLRKIFRQQEKADLFLFLGDGEADWRQICREHPGIVRGEVRGNCDFGSNLSIWETKEAGGKKIFFTHGHEYGVKLGLTRMIFAAKEQKAAIVLYGHTHQAQVEYDEDLLVMNPGSCGKGYPASYGIIDITDAGIVPVIIPIP